MDSEKLHDYLSYLNVTDYDDDYGFGSYYNLSKSAIEVLTGAELNVITEDSNYVRLPSKASNSDIFSRFWDRISDPDDLSALDSASRRKGFFRVIKNLGYYPLFTAIEESINTERILNWSEENNISL